MASVEDRADIKAVLDEVADMVSEESKVLMNDLAPEMRSRAADLLHDAARLEILYSAGENTRTAQVALDASFAAVSRQSQSVIRTSAKDLVSRVIWTVLRKALEVTV